MRWVSLCIFILAACAPQLGTAIGTTCNGESLGICNDAGTQLLQCSGGEWVAYSDCHGGGGCRYDNDVASCDTSGNTAGDICPDSSEGKVRCEPDGGSRILKCEGSMLNVIYECQAPTICGLSDGGLTCI